uniref:Phospholipase B-like n=1 Tax=Alexandrium andersonii TaxID=327968 RepID=A0A7S2FIG6_9DINO|mmetsp:Transcript_24884/g.56559  ORF Transcript_24884/g.56559 Transcript_24884/m.56559 type:complete len:254 (+) Transcript_24884:83-844(+)
MARVLAMAAMVPMAGASFLRQAPADACACVNWQQAYASGGAKCGDGHELYVGTSSGMPRLMARLLLGMEFCDGFYKRIKDNFCVNLDHANAPDAWYGGQWCYVSSQCMSSSPANGTGSLRVKLCTPGQDKMLRDKTVEELTSWAKAEDFETGLLLKMAYPTEKEAKWPLVQDAYLNPAAVNLESNATKQALYHRVSTLTAASKPLILDSKDGHPPFAVVRGGSRADLLELTGQKDMAHPNSITSLKCTAGCSQ